MAVHPIIEVYQAKIDKLEERLAIQKTEFREEIKMLKKDRDEWKKKCQQLILNRNK